MPSYFFLSFFGEIHWKIVFLVKNMTISERSTEILRIFFFNKFEKGRIKRIIWICLNKYFCQSSKMGQLLTKIVFLHKLSHIQLNYATQLFLRILDLILWKPLFFVLKVTISERNREILWNLYFLTILKRRKSWGKFGFV